LGESQQHYAIWRCCSPSQSEFFYYGSYIVNAVADCNGCHSNNEFAAGGNPFLGQPVQINQQCYLNGGQHFGTKSRPS
jgi:hypothetical protein